MNAERVNAAYLRKSYVNAENPGDASEDAQLEAVRRLCGPDVTIYKDWGRSGATAEGRPEYMRLRADIAAGRIASVCAYSLSRLGRHTRELLDFIELCQRHDVAVRTAVETIDTSTAMGRAMLTVMGAFAQLEREQGAERSAAARLARERRHEAAGALVNGKLPNSVPLYGFRHVARPDPDDPKRKLIVREPDPDRPIEPVLRAYREEGSMQAAVRRLNADVVPAPKGACPADCAKDHRHRTGVWHTGTLRRILAGHGVALPEVSPVSRRRPVGMPSRFRGLILCHCGGLMTPRAFRGQYYCSRSGRLGADNHGPVTIPERRLIELLTPEAERIPRRSSAVLADAHAAERERLIEEKRRKGVRYDTGSLTDEEYRTEARRIDAKLATLASRESRIEAIRVEQPIDLANGDPAETNAALRLWWRAVRLDGSMTPTVEWLIDPDSERSRHEDELMRQLGMAALAHGPLDLPMIEDDE